MNESYFRNLERFPEVREDHLTLTDDSPHLEFYLLRTLKGDGKKTFPGSAW